MNEFKNFISDIRVIIGLAVLIVILGLWLIIQKIRSGRFKSDLNELEARYNAIKSIPLTLKMNKAVAISRVDQETAQRVAEAKEKYDKVQADLASISSTLADAEDDVLVGKLKKADGLMTQLETDLAVNEDAAKELEQVLDGILARETEQRQEVTALKNRFRALKSQAQENSSKLSYNWPVFEQKIADTEKMFSTFEEWMFSSDFDKANHELESIKYSMDELEEMINDMPGLLEDARGIIPRMAEDLHHEYIKNRNRGVYLKHLELEKNVSILTSSLKDDLKRLKVGNADGVRAHLDDY
ncbi:MAG: selenide, water dikinase, partial [Solobacterium sp.]|nr:selenide, water dikinase [Solobacterium sp.]